MTKAEVIERVLKRYKAHDTPDIKVSDRQMLLQEAVKKIMAGMVVEEAIGLVVGEHLAKNDGDLDHWLDVVTGSLQNEEATC